MTAMHRFAKAPVGDCCPSRHIRRWLLLLPILLWTFTASQAQQSPLQINTLGDGAVPLDGSWQFHLGDNPDWASPSFDDSTGKNGWEQLTVDQPWGAQGHENYVGFAWYRRHISLANKTGTQLQLALLMQNVDDAYEVYWNGRPVGQFGKLPPNPVLYFDQPAQTYELGELGTAQSAVLAVRVWMPAPMSSDPGIAGGFETVPLLGTSEAIAARKAMLDYEWLRARQISFGLDSLYVLIGILSLLAWSRDRSQWMLFWMALFCFYPPLNLLVLSLRVAWPANLAFGIMQSIYQLGDIPLWFLLLWLLDLRDNASLVKWVRIASVTIFVTSILDGLVAVFGWTSPYVLTMQISDAVLSTIVLILAPVSVAIVGFAVFRHKRLNPIRWLIAIIVFVDEMLTEFANAASQGIRFTHWSLSDKFQTAIFTINGSSMNPIQVGNTVLMLTLVYAVVRNLIDNRHRQRTLEEEFKSAREVQQVLIPDTQPEIPGYALTSSYKPAQEVGGDFFQIIPLEGGSTLVILGDVSGKGLKAAMAVSLIVGMVRALAEIFPSPSALLMEINERVHGRLQGGFATCIALRLDSNGDCTIANAGHLAPFLNEIELELPGAFPLGLAGKVVYEETTAQFNESDRLALYTDGLLEARNPTGELYGFDRLGLLFATQPSAEQATEAAVAFGQDDDITVLILTRVTHSA